MKNVIKSLETSKISLNKKLEYHKFMARKYIPGRKYHKKEVEEISNFLKEIDEAIKILKQWKK